MELKALLLGSANKIKEVIGMTARACPLMSASPFPTGMWTWVVWLPEWVLVGRVDGPLDVHKGG